LLENNIVLTDKKACIKSALTVANGFPFTNIVNVSSFSVVIRLPNQDFFVNSGDDSGVKWTSSEDAVTQTMITSEENDEDEVTLKFSPMESGWA